MIYATRHNSDRRGRTLCCYTYELFINWESKYVINWWSEIIHEYSNFGTLIYFPRRRVYFGFHWSRRFIPISIRFFGAAESTKVMAGTLSRKVIIAWVGLPKIYDQFTVRQPRSQSENRHLWVSLELQASVQFQEAVCTSSPKPRGCNEAHLLVGTSGMHWMDTQLSLTYRRENSTTISSSHLLCSHSHWAVEPNTFNHLSKEHLNRFHKPNKFMDFEFESGQSGDVGRSQRKERKKLCDHRSSYGQSIWVNARNVRFYWLFPNVISMWIAPHSSLAVHFLNAKSSGAHLVFNLMQLIHKICRFVFFSFLCQSTSDKMCFFLYNFVSVLLDISCRASAFSPTTRHLFCEKCFDTNRIRWKHSSEIYFKFFRQTPCLPYPCPCAHYENCCRHRIRNHTRAKQTNRNERQICFLHEWADSS